MESKIKIIIFSVSLIALLFLLLIWSKVGKLVESPAVYRGSIMYGFEGRGFVPCDIPNEYWWVKEVEEDFAKEMHFALTGNHYQEAYIEAEMLVSGKGSHGHMGMSDREMEIIKVQKLSTEFPRDCQET